MSEGFLYIAMSDLIDEAELSARKLREEVDEEINVAVVTDEVIDSDVFDNIIIADSPHYGFHDKVKYMQMPYDRTVYLDTDIYVIGDVSELFSLLDEYDVAAAHAPTRVSEELTDVPVSFPELNTGVIALRNSESTDKFIDQWRANCNDLGVKEDQPSFRKTLFYSDVEFATLPPEYNVRFDFPGYLEQDAKILHGRIIDIDTQGVNKDVDPREVETKINQTGIKRVYYLEKGSFKIHSHVEPIFDRLARSLSERGIFLSLKRAWGKFERRFTFSC